MDFSPDKGSLTTVHGVIPAMGMQLIKHVNLTPARDLLKRHPMNV